MLRSPTTTASAPGGQGHGAAANGGGAVGVEGGEHAFWEQAFPERVVKAGEGRHHGEPVEKGKVAARDEDALEKDNDHSRDVPGLARPEDKPGSDQLSQMIHEDACFQEAPGQEMKPAAESIRDGLGLEVVEKRGQVAPAFVPADLDQARPEHYPEDEPAQEPDDRDRRLPLGEGPRIIDRAQEDGEKSGLQQLEFPTVAVPVLADVDDREVQRP